MSSDSPVPTMRKLLPIVGVKEGLSCVIFLRHLAGENTQLSPCLTPTLGTFYMNFRAIWQLNSLSHFAFGCMRHVVRMHMALNIV